jgi:hypothetical protein
MAGFVVGSGGLDRGLQEDFFDPDEIRSGF